MTSHTDVLGAVHLTTQRIVAVELQRLARRIDLSAQQIDAVAAALEHVSTSLIVDRIASWQGDPDVVAELFGQGTPTSAEDRRCPN
ncbi:hypothetical protein [Rhodococcus triatomae]|nr:hypothetical protein G419_03998 [Rhodococcus triatomae BKS 15-14]